MQLRFPRIFFCVLFTCITTSAHVCGPNRIDLEVGKACLWRVWADHVESLSFYQPTVIGDPRIAEAYPKSTFYSHHWDFVIQGLTPGTNYLQVLWSYQPTGAAGVCVVMIVVKPDDGVKDLQTVQSTGLLVTRAGTPHISSADLFWQIDRYIPRQTPKLLVFAQCYGGNMAMYPLFQNMPNTTVLSATSPNQEAHYGGYHDDAARALKPETGRTAENIHEEGSVGKSTIIPKDPNDTSPDPIDPTQDKATFHKYAELPRITGTVPPNQFLLDPVTNTGPVHSRHVVIFAGSPDSRMELILRQGTTTIPASIGNLERFSDNGDRDQIRANFLGNPNTTVTAVGGPPDAEGWDYSGDLEGLHKAIQEAGEAIEASADPSKEQFILYVTDHGEPGSQMFPSPRIPPESARVRAAGAITVGPGTRATVATNLQPYAIQDTIIDSMLRAADNQPGLRLRIAASGLNSPQVKAGDFSLELKNDAGLSLILEDFATGGVDLDGDGILGSQPEEALLAFFPLAETDLINKLIPQPFSIDLINNSSQSLQLNEILLLTGAISMGNSQPQSFITSVRRLPNGNLEIVVNGLKGKRHYLETSSDLNTWRRADERVFADYTEIFSLPAGSSSTFVRLSRP
jgi:hypothetical protein